MDWLKVLEQIFELVVYPVLSIAGIYITYLISVKIKELKQKTNNDLAKKYLDMLNDTISSAVLATTQTYVESLKKQGKFDAEAQKVAFKQTYDAVMKVLTDEAINYITVSVGDLETYITNKIEADVKLSKNV
jgi:methionyl-tRNA synthetase